MSKLQLKKELKAMSREQLEQMILDCYESRKEIKAYLDFFMNPDIGKLMEKYKIAISREMARGKRGYSKARISVIRNLIKEFSSFQPGFEAETELRVYALSIGLLAETGLRFTDTLINGITQLMMQTLEAADRNMVADRLLERLTAMLDSPHSGTRYFRHHLRKALSEFAPQ